MFTQLIKKVERSLHETIEDILPFIYRKKLHLGDIWLPRYEQKYFGSIQKNADIHFFQKRMKLIMKYVCNKISLNGRFVFKMNGISSVTSHIKKVAGVFYKMSNKVKKMLHFENFE